MDLVTGLLIGCILILMYYMDSSTHRYLNSLDRYSRYSLDQHLDCLEERLEALEDSVKHIKEEQGRMEDLHDEDSDLAT